MYINMAYFLTLAAMIPMIRTTITTRNTPTPTPVLKMAAMAVHELKAKVNSTNKRIVRIF
jgi:hypothetical protein